MKRARLNIPAGLVLFSLSVLLLLPISAMAERDGGWFTTEAPEYVFHLDEIQHDNQKYLVMTMISQENEDVDTYWGPAQDACSYYLKPHNADSDMTAFIRFDKKTSAVLYVLECTKNCLMIPGPAGEIPLKTTMLTKFFGDKEPIRVASRVPKTGQTECWDTNGNKILCGPMPGQDGQYQFGVSPEIRPNRNIAYTVHGWAGERFTDNRDGSVNDNLTGLIWLRNANCLGNLNWPEALKACNHLASGKCGLTDCSVAGDWRLPNANELHSLIDQTLT